MSAVPRARSVEASAVLSTAELSAAISALQVELGELKSRIRETETQNESLRETIANLTDENQLLKQRIDGDETERMQPSELQLSLGSLLDADK